MTDPTKTDFGYEEVPIADKARRVGHVFDSVASRYDLMNDLMSMGIHRLWKMLVLENSGIRAGGRALDIAGGTGDLSIGLAKKVGPQGRVVLSDINGSMLRIGRDRTIDKGHNNILVTQADAEQLPFADQSFDLITIAFGLRNVTRKDVALKSMLRVLKPGGRLMVLEFSQPISPGLGKIYDLYSFNVLPGLGKLITGDADSYRYLAESIRKHPAQEPLAQMMRDAGFERVDYTNLSAGIVAIHSGYRPI
jgi:demethylmenaquinone methyltransferase / 2-methoxy-6-polyprenyl-1,4-benzoquinol methylase